MMFVIGNTHGSIILQAPHEQMRTSGIKASLMEEKQKCRSALNLTQNTSALAECTRWVFTNPALISLRHKAQHVIKRQSINLLYTFFLAFLILGPRRLFFSDYRGYIATQRGFKRARRHPGDSKHVNMSSRILFLVVLLLVAGTALSALPKFDRDRTSDVIASLTHGLSCQKCYFRNRRGECEANWACLFAMRRRPVMVAK
ncbi:uncharacterized protein [Penaeus vannamei]|uniref:uncharacterized protein n=1 Tax=Penaeus vannamei TaxID=6689 RepID=UPI00387F994A